MPTCRVPYWSMMPSSSAACTACPLISRRPSSAAMRTRASSRGMTVIVWRSNASSIDRIASTSSRVGTRRA